MTIAVALCGSGGTVLCADSQETVAGYAKRKVDKLIVAEFGEFNFGIVGAGSGNYIDMVSSEIMLKVGKASLLSVQKTISETLIEFYNKHIWVRPSSEAPQMDFLMVVQPRRGHCYTFHTSETAVNWIQDGHKSIGIGSYLADYVLDAMFSETDGTEEHLITSAVHALKEARDNIDGCGDDPSIHVFRKDGTYYWIHKDDLVALEENLARFKQFSKGAFCSLSKPELRTIGMESELIVLRGEQEEIFSRIRESAKSSHGSVSDENIA